MRIEREQRLCCGPPWRSRGCKIKRTMHLGFWCHPYKGSVINFRKLDEILLNESLLYYSKLVRMKMNSLSFRKIALSFELIKILPLHCGRSFGLSWMSPYAQNSEDNHDSRNNALHSDSARSFHLKKSEAEEERPAGPGRVNREYGTPGDISIYIYVRR